MVAAASLHRVLLHMQSDLRVLLHMQTAIVLLHTCTPDTESRAARLTDGKEVPGIIADAGTTMGLLLAQLGSLHGAASQLSPQYAQIQACDRTWS